LKRQIPDSGAAANYDTDAVARIIERWRAVAGNLMPILHDVQQALGFVPPESVAQIARALNLSRAEVHGVITFYHDFRQAPAGHRIVKVCQAESCQAMGSRKLTAALERALGCAIGMTTADGEVTLEPVYCLGLCACSPAVMIDHDVLGRATPEGVLARLAAGTKSAS